MKYRITIVTLLTSLALAASAQFNTLRFDTQKGKDGLERLTTITFFDSTITKIYRKLDVASLNPFIILPFSQKNVNGKEFPVHEYKDHKLGDLVSKDRIKAYFGGHGDPRRVITSGESSSVTSPESGPSLVLAYNYLILSSGIPAGNKSAMFLYDKKGNEIFKFNDYNVNVKSPVISPKGRFVCHAFGVVTDEGAMIEPGIRVLDMSQRRYQDFPMNNVRIKSITDRYAVFSGDAKVGSEIDGTNLIIFDFRKDLVYTQIYSPELLSNITFEFGDKLKMFIEGGERVLEREFSIGPPSWQPFGDVLK